MQRGIGGFFGRPDLVLVDFACKDPTCPQLVKHGKESVFKTQKALNAHQRTHPSASSLASDAQADRAIHNQEALIASARLEAPPFAAPPPQPPPNNASGNDEQIPSPGRPAKKSKGAAKRHQFTVEQKVKNVRAYAAVQAEIDTERASCDPPLGPAPAKGVLEKVAASIGVAFRTLDQHVRNAKTIEAEYAARQQQTGGSRQRQSIHAKRVYTPGKGGKKPLFPKAEERLATHIRERRADNLAYPASRLRCDFKRFAKVEALEAGEESDLYEKWASCKFTTRMQGRFLRRQRLSCRKVSCLKAKPLAKIILEGRGFYQAMVEILVDADEKALSLLDPVFGRYLLSSRFNKDEVPLFWGSPSRQINPTGDKATHVSYPDGFGSRFATADLCVSADGYLLPVMLIFYGTGQRVEKYVDNLDCVVVHYQKKAWKDGTGELHFYRHVFLPHVTANDLKDTLMMHDNLKSHFNHTALRYAHQYCFMLSLNPPPHSTPYLQAIDDNIGRLIRLDIEVLLMAAIDEKGPAYKWTTKEKRALFVAATVATVQLWRTDARKVQLLKNAVARTGLAIEVSGHVPMERTAEQVDPTTLERSTNSRLQPVRFPADFGSSILDSAHPEHGQATPFAPFQPRGTVPFDAAQPDAPTPPRVPSGDESSGSSAEDDGPDDWELQMEHDDQLFIEDAPEDALDNERQLLEHRGQRGCLPGCECELDAYKRGCVCFSHRGNCLEQCACSCTRPKQRLALVEGDYVNTNVAIAQNEGEVEVDSVLSHLFDDGIPQFEVLWVDGDTTHEPLDSFVDASDGAVNAKVLAYAASCQLDLGPAVELLLLILRGERDSYHSSNSEGN